MKQRRMDYHLHTHYSMDGRQSIDDLCRTMVERGVEEICLTEHIEPGHPDPAMDIPPIWDVLLSEVADTTPKANWRPLAAKGAMARSMTSQSYLPGCGSIFAHSKRK